MLEIIKIEEKKRIRDGEQEIDIGGGGAAQNSHAARGEGEAVQ